MKTISSGFDFQCVARAAIAAAAGLTMSGYVYAEAITKPMSWTEGSGMVPGPVDGTSVVLEKGEFGVAMAIKSTGLTPEMSSRSGGSLFRTRRSVPPFRARRRKQ